MDEQQLDSGKENELTKIRIKVCGMTMPSQVQQLDEMGVDFAGFIFYPKSPRYALKQMTTNDLKKIKGKINKVGVFVNAEVDEVLRIVNECGLYLVQLHGDETPRTCEMISNYVSVIKAFRISEDDNIEWKIREYYDAADMYLFDTEGAGYGGTGKKFNWQLLKEQNIRKSFFLSGGVQPGDENAIAEFVKEPVAKDLFSLDINSKFEIMPGVKDMDKVREFVENLKGKQR